MGSSAALSSNQEKQQDDSQSWDLNYQLKGREPRTQGQCMAALKRGTAKKTQTESETILFDN